MFSVLNKLSEYIATLLQIKKTLIHTLFCLFLKFSKAFSVSLNPCLRMFDIQICDLRNILLNV